MSDLTAKQDAFAMAYVETNNASEAYRRTYNVSHDTKPSSVTECASRLLADLKVTARVIELQEVARERHRITIDSLTSELEEARKNALAEKQSSAAVSATMGKAKLHGLDINKVDWKTDIIVKIGGDA